MSTIKRNDQIKWDNNTAIKLKQFYRTSQTYLERLKKHDEKCFKSYIELCKELIPAGSTILDCGCGIGLSSYLLAKIGFKVIGIDMSPLFISEAKKRYGNQPNLIFFIGDANKMSFAEHSFDAVCSFDLLEHVNDLNGVLKEMYRVLKDSGLLIIFMPNHLNPFEHLNRCLKWGKKDKYKPWEAKNRIGAFYQFLRTSLLTVVKAFGINKKIYYLKPILSNEEDSCGRDFDATWLTNWFDIENILKELGFFVKCILPQNIDSRILHAIDNLKLPKSLKSFYIKMEAPCRIVGRKTNAN